MFFVCSSPQCSWPLASAEVLTTANPIGAGKWAVLGAYLSESSFGGSNSGISASTIGGYAGYGLNAQTDLFVTLGEMTTGSITVPGGSYKIANTAIGCAAKYALMAESASMPVSVSAGIGYKALSATTDPASTTTNGSQVYGGIGVSKTMAPFVPYCGLTYRSTGGDIGTTTQLDLTVGTAIAWSKQGAVFAEYTMQSITPNVGSAYTDPQIALAVGYTI